MEIEEILDKMSLFFFPFPFLLCFLMTLSDMRLSLMRQIIPIRRRHLLLIQLLGFMWLQAVTLKFSQE